MATLPLSELGAVSLIDFETFTRKELADAFGVPNGSMVTKTCQWLNNLAGKFPGFDRIEDSRPLTQDQAYFVYAVQCYRRVMIAGAGMDSVHLRPLITELINKKDKGMAVIDAIVKAGGGSKEDFNKRIKAIQVKKRCKRINGSAIEVNFQVAN